MPATPSSRYIFGTLPWYSVLIVTGIIAALLIASREEKRLQLPKDTTVDLALCVIPFGIIGARLYYVIFAWDVFRHDPVSILKIWQGGLAIYGGIIGGFLAGLLFSRIRKIPVTQLMDMIAPALPLAQAIGRWGNYFNQEAYGAAIFDPAWQFFPAGVLIGGRWYMATFFYESMWNLLTFLLLMFSRRRMRRSGDVFLWYASLYGAGRLIIEGLRSDSLMFGAFRVSQMLSLVICTVCTILLVIRAIRCSHKHTSAVLLILPLTVIAAAYFVPIPDAIRHLLVSLAFLSTEFLAYLQIKPSATEDTLCPQHPSKT